MRFLLLLLVCGVCFVNAVPFSQSNSWGLGGVNDVVCSNGVCHEKWSGSQMGLNNNNNNFGLGMGVDTQYATQPQFSHQFSQFQQQQQQPIQQQQQQLPQFSQQFQQQQPLTKFKWGSEGTQYGGLSQFEQPLPLSLHSKYSFKDMPYSMPIEQPLPVVNKWNFNNNNNNMLYGTSGVVGSSGVVGGECVGDMCPNKFGWYGSSSSASLASPSCIGDSCNGKYNFAAADTNTGLNSGFGWGSVGNVGNFGNFGNVGVDYSQQYGLSNFDTSCANGLCPTMTMGTTGLDTPQTSNNWNYGFSSINTVPSMSQTVTGMSDMSYDLGSSGLTSASDLSLPYSLPTVSSSKNMITNLPVVHQAPIIQSAIYQDLGTVTRPAYGVFSAPVMSQLRVNPTIIEQPIYATNQPIIRQSQAVMQQQAPIVDTITAPIEYATAQINKQHYAQPIIQPRIITQPIIQQRLIEQPIFRQHIVQQPIVRPIINQPVITPNYLQKTQIQNALSEQPIITPKVTDQTIVQPILSEKHYDNQPITAPGVQGQKSF